VIEVRRLSLPSSFGAESPAIPIGTYNDKVVRQFAIMTVVWGIVGMAVGVFIAAQLFWPELNFGIPWLSYGRLRPLHTNAVIFAFGGSVVRKNWSQLSTADSSGTARPDSQNGLREPGVGRRADRQ